jgi:asparagine synthase (glutamine-hydrolysing)
VPFLDRDFLDVAMTIDPHDKMIRKDQGRMEKYILRKVGVPRLHSHDVSDKH